MRTFVLRGLPACVALLISVGCGNSTPPPPPVPAPNPQTQGGPVKEGTLEVPVATVEKGIRAVVDGIAWKGLSVETGPSGGNFDAEGTKTDRAAIRYVKQGETSTTLTVSGSSATSKETVDALYDKIVEKAK